MGSILLVNVRSKLVNSTTNQKYVEKSIVSTSTAPPTIDNINPSEIQSANLEDSNSMSVTNTEHTGVETNIPVS